MKPMICSQCGAPMSNAHKCDYCGTHFYDEIAERYIPKPEKRGSTIYGSSCAVIGTAYSFPGIFSYERSVTGGGSYLDYLENNNVAIG